MFSAAYQQTKEITKGGGEIYNATVSISETSEIPAFLGIYKLNSSCSNKMEGKTKQLELHYYEEIIDFISKNICHYYSGYNTVSMKSQNTNLRFTLK